MPDLKLFKSSIKFSRKIKDNKIKTIIIADFYMLI